VCVFVCECAEKPSNNHVIGKGHAGPGCLVPWPTLFFVVWFTLIIIHGGGRAVENGEGRWGRAQLQISLTSSRVVCNV